MKNIVVNADFRQSDLKPSSLLEEYIALLKKDVSSLLATVSLTKVPCPACHSSNSKRHFEKFTLTYQECSSCQSLYVSGRPSDEAIVAFYREASSKIFWRNQLSEVSRQQRKTSIIKPRFEWITDSAAEHRPQAGHWVDIHTGQQRYLEAMASSRFALKTTVHPYCDVPADSGIAVIHDPWWKAQLGKEADIVTLFEVLDHAANPDHLLKQTAAMMSRGGLCFITAILSSGLDVKELREQAQNIYPPDRLNVFTVEGLKQLLARHGFECLEFSTPGILDLEIIASALKSNPDLNISPFIRELARSTDEDVKKAFSEFLQANLLSSYGRILVRKK